MLSPENPVEREIYLSIYIDNESKRQNNIILTVVVLVQRWSVDDYVKIKVNSENERSERDNFRSGLRLSR